MPSAYLDIQGSLIFSLSLSFCFFLSQEGKQLLLKQIKACYSFHIPRTCEIQRQVLWDRKASHVYFGFAK